jgi:hypothetical protein
MPLLPYKKQHHDTDPDLPPKVNIDIYFADKNIYTKI